jgi:hypothetical protein
LPEIKGMTPSSLEIFLVKPVTLQVQSLLYDNKFYSVKRAALSLGWASLTETMA